MRKTRYDEDGFLILDEPLLSPKRLWYAFWKWCWWEIQGVHLPFWGIIRYERRPYISHKDGFY